MKNKLFKSFLILVAAFTLVFVTACTGGTGGGGGGSTPSQAKKSKITYVLNGGELPKDAATEYSEGVALKLPTPTKDGETFAGWYDNDKFEGDAIQYFDKNTKGNKTLYAKWTAGASGVYTPKWEPNKIGFNGGNMKLVIKVLPVAEFDPTDPSFKGENKAVRQAHLSLIEAKYGVDIVYSAWDNEAPWGPERVKFINNSYADGSFAKNNVYVVNITSQWIPTLVKGNALFDLYDMNSGKGAFADAGYEQDKTLNEATAVSKKVYGYCQGSARPDYFLYYNYDLAKKTGLADPAEMYFRGEWTWSKFKEWIYAAQPKLESDQTVIDAGYAEFFIGAAASTGEKLVDVKSATVRIARSSVAGVFDQMKTFYSAGLWNKAHGTHDVTTQFTTGKTIFASGGLWFLKEATRFEPDNKADFQIGCVPYPAADNNEMAPYTQPYSYIDSQGNTVEVTEPIKNVDGEVVKTATGEDIYGLNLENSANFFMPYTGTSCFSVVNFNPLSNGFTPQVCFNILYDLYEGQGDDPAQAVKPTADEAYRAVMAKKFDSSIFVDVVMSVQNKPNISYYELIEVVSMTVGDGSHFGPDAFWPLCSGLISSSEAAATKFDSVLDKYQEALDKLGI